MHRRPTSQRLHRLAVLVAAITLAACAAPATGGAAVPHLGRVFLIVGENTSYEEITPDDAPFLTGNVRSRGAWATNVHSFPFSSSTGQYMAMVSGQFTRCEAADRLPGSCHQRVPSLFAQLAARGRSWRDWQESMPRPCAMTDSGSPSRRNHYSAHHNPALYLTRLRGRACRTGDVPMGTTGPNDTSALDRALRTGHVADFNLIVPNGCESGYEDCGGGSPAASFDDFLAREVPKIEASPAFGHDATILVTWDEGGDAPHHGHVLLAALGPLVRPGGVDRSLHSHFGLERTLAEGFGVPPLAHARQVSPISAIWR
jgi:hypothetical protein